MYYAPGDSALKYVTSLQLYDVAAIQDIYGRDYTTRSGDTTYDLGHGLVGGTPDTASIYTIWDGGGTDIINASGYSTAVQIDLRQGEFSSIGSDGNPNGDAVPFDSAGHDAGNVSIAFYTVIENAYGTGQNDSLIGNSWNNVLYGANGNDKLYGDGVSYDGNAGFEQANTLPDGSGNVYPWGPGGVAPDANDSGNDVLIGGNGNDTLYGGKGNDVLDGGFDAAWLNSAAPHWNDAHQFDGAIASFAPDGETDFNTVNYTGLGDTLSFNADAMTVAKGFLGADGTDQLHEIEQIIGNPLYLNTVALSPTDVWSEVSPGHLIVNGIDLENFSAIAATAPDQNFALSEPSGLTVTGDGTTTVTYAGPVILNENNGQFYDQTGSVHDTLTGATVSADQLGANGQLDMDLPNTAASETLQFAPHFPFDMPEFDYAAFAGAAAFTITVNNTIQAVGADTQIDEQTNAMVQLSNGAVHQGEIEAFTTPLETGLAAAALDLHASGVGGSLEGTNNGDTVTVTSSPEGTGTVSYAPFQFDSGTGNDVANVGASGFVYEYRGGDDTINLTNGTSLGGLMLWGGIEAGDVSVAGLSAGTPVLDVAGYGTITIHGSGGLEPLPAITLESGGSLTINADGTLTASGTADTDVTLTGTWGNDTWTGHDGVNYTFYGQGGNDVLEGGNGNDTLYGGDGNTIFKYGAGGGQDTFIDYSGHDSISIDASLHPADLSYVQSGSDLLIAADWDGSLTNGVADDANTITVKDFYGDPSSISTIGFADGSPDLDLHGVTLGVPGGTHDTWTISDSSFTAVDDTGGVNRIVTDQNYADFSSTVTGGTLTLYNDGEAYATVAAPDTLSTIAFSDGTVLSVPDLLAGHTVTYQVSEGDDIVDASAEGGTPASGPLFIDLGGGNDSFNGSSHGDIVDGGAGNDQLFGGAGDDHLYGGDGNDFISGGAGNNIIDGGAGEDTIFYGFAQHGVTVDLSQNIATDNGFGGTDTLTNIEDVQGSAFDDTITGSDGDNQLIGGAGNDTINGGGGDDFIDGGTGNDTLAGGTGDDNYLFQVGDGHDTVTESGGFDTLDIFGGVTIANVAFAQNGNDLLIQYDAAGDSVTVKGFFSGNPDNVVERIAFDNGTTFDLTTLLNAAQVNHPPVAQPDDFTVADGATLAGNVLADNGHGADSDPDGDALSVVVQTVLTANGGMAVFLASGDFTYINSSGFTGTHTFDYTLLDGHGGSATGTVDLTVTQQEAHAFSSDNVLFPMVHEEVNIANLVPPGTPALGVIHGDLDAGATAASATITFVQSVAGYANTLGSFEIAADGTIQNAAIDFANGHTAVAGETATVSLDAGTQLGLFIISNGFNANNGYSGINLNTGTLNFIYDYGHADQRAANIDDSGSHISLVYTDASDHSTVLQGTDYFTTERGGSTAINTDDAVHVIAGAPDAGDTSDLRIGFEDASCFGRIDGPAGLSRAERSPSTLTSSTPPPAAHRNQSPNCFDKPERPRSLKKPVNGTQRTRSSKCQDKPRTALFESVSQQHRSDSKQSKCSKRIHCSILH